MSQSLDDHGHSLTATDAHGFQTELFVVPARPIGERAAATVTASTMMVFSNTFKGFGRTAPL